MNDWLPRVADLIDAMRKFWEDLVPRYSTSCGRAETFFNCIHALMSYQLRGLIQRSIDHFYNTIKVYGVSYPQFSCIYNYTTNIIFFQGWQFHASRIRCKSSINQTATVYDDVPFGGWKILRSITGHVR